MALPFNIPLYFCYFSALVSLFHPTLAQWDTYLIHMDSSSMPKAFSSHQNWFLSTLSTISDSSSSSSSDSKLIYSYTNAMHGFSAVLSPSELETIKNHPGFISATKDREVKMDTTHSSKFLGLNLNSGAWPDSGYGKDVIVAVVDTGIWPESKSFVDDGMPEVPARWKGACETGTQFNASNCNKKLIGARFFNKGLLAKYPNLTISMNSSRDVDGHGTHTSSTAAGNYVQNANFFGYASGVSSGMAPRSRVAMYKALWEEGAYTSDIVAALDQAIEDGADVISLSLGLDGVPLYEDPIAIGAFGAMQKGIFVSTSAGNEGPYIGSLHNGIPWVLTVAAGTIDREFIGKVNLGNGVSVPGLSMYPGNSSSGKFPIVYGKGCKSQVEMKKFQGKLVVCLDNNNTLGDQVYNAQNSKIAGAVFITNNSDLEFFLESQIPSVYINLENGKKILDFLKPNGSSEPEASFEFRGTNVGAKPAPMVTSYSSRGPSQSCPFVLKPDIMAPGSLVLASWPDKTAVTTVSSGELYSNFNIISGTSMSCPHATGIAALIRGVHPEWTPAAVRSAMMTTADISDNTNRPISDIGFSGAAATPFAMGAGQLNPNRALDPGLVYDAETGDYVNLMCALNYTSQQIQTVTRSSPHNCSNPSLDLNYPSFIFFSNSSSAVWEFSRTVTSVGDSAAVYSAKLTPLDGFKVSVSPDKLVFRQKYDKQTYKLTVESIPAVKKDVVVVFGFLSWEEIGGNRIVRSPIVGTDLTIEVVK